MKKMLLVLLAFISMKGFTQTTTLYETGNGYTDAWVNWATTTSSDVTGSVNGVNYYSFTLGGTNGDAYTIELVKEFTGLSYSTMAMNYTVQAGNNGGTASLEILYSTDNTNWTSVTTHAYPASLSVSAFATSFSSSVPDFYLKLKLTGYHGSPSNVAFQKLTITADESDYYEEAETSGIDSKEISTLLNSTQVYLAHQSLMVKTALNSFEISLYNLNGQLVSTHLNESVLDVTALQKGLYFVKVMDVDSKQFITKKVVI